MCLFGLIELTLFYLMIFISTFEVELGNISLTLSPHSYPSVLCGKCIYNSVLFQILFSFGHILGFG